ncbi:TIGR00730 family Rossman fold protein [Penaeicola halotolerans]|uniref:LOG family protein n=1 Tax=Penaeicola halotolerans TaxID=2793196 RepID=UPI001CF8A995|nr:TIGR00730 family Rossman fold protein [Penaeicola halotolerans]
MQYITVFCGSSKGSNPLFVEQAKAMAQVFLQHEIGLVYGGGNVGLMGEIADAMMDGGGEVIGVIPQRLVDIEVAHHDISRLEVVPDMRVRKARMAELADGFITLPGGIGTWEELFEVFTLNQLGYMTKPIGLLNVAGYYDKLLEFISHAVEMKFFKPQQYEMLLVAEEPEELLRKMVAYKPIKMDKWIK